MKKTALMMMALAAMATMTVPALALDDEQAAGVVETRQSVLHVVRWNIIPMAGMVKERIPYDAAKFRVHSARTAYMLTMLTDAFRVDTSGNNVETEALDIIWSEFDEFERLAGAAQEKADAVNAAAMGDDFAAVQGAFVELGQSCKNCHDKFREESD